jgi:hypothetical protein
MTVMPNNALHRDSRSPLSFVMIILHPFPFWFVH